jgi:hypothetical protein
MKQPQIDHHENDNDSKENTEENSLSLIATEKGKKEYIECSQQMILSSAFRGVDKLLGF